MTTIELDKARNLKYGIKAIALVERKLEKNFTSIDFEKITIDEIVTILWSGLYHEDITLTTEKLLDIIDEKGISISYIVEKISESIDGAFNANPTQATAD